ncbi:cytochrome c oxidase assembly protein [Actinoallomurus soli]|uniref:cytochrome c oxidase assembly protein n=1 Tax=Actinoallomurus soli TaxID=2952535 RepID=UPI002093DDE9|nr:cytochrome c oxidase assembly protein [Actinoallomurus soli]MCO5972314.1 cytochrome c oxidase assembly protein [Actinoallomurus soli]
MSGHLHHAGGTTPGTLPALALVLAAAAAYLWLVARARDRDRGPQRLRTGSFLGGCALLAVALLPPVAAHGDFRRHMLQHMIIGMYAPLALVLGAPLTVLLRALPAGRARQVTRLLRARPARVLTHPVIALMLSTGSLGVLYFTPLYDAAAARPAGHWLLHAHFLASGYLFAWVVAGPDPAPGRPGVPARLVLLGVAVAAHATVAQLLYGGFGVHVHAPAGRIQDAAAIMYYGGDVAELLLAAALVATWRPERPRRRAALLTGSS